ncbi:MAG: hypothetical protein AAGA30_18025, partial [Planctomycetota bacterium]
MEKRTFYSPDVRFDSEIEFCRPSWNRKRKYVSWQHWLTTKTAPGSHKNIEKTVRFKLYEMGHYAGSVILEVGINGDRSSVVAVRAAVEAGHDVQYYGVGSSTEAIMSVNDKFVKKRLDRHAAFFHGTLVEFRNTMPITPTMVIVNASADVDSTLSHLALFLANGTPVLVKNWYQSRGDLKSEPSVKGYLFCGRFGEGVLLQSEAAIDEVPRTYSGQEFAKIREQFRVDREARQLIHNRDLDGLLDAENERPVVSDKKWPFSASEIQYPETLPD